MPYISKSYQLVPRSGSYRNYTGTPGTYKVLYVSHVFHTIITFKMNIFTFFPQFYDRVFTQDKKERCKLNDCSFMEYSIDIYDCAATLSKLDYLPPPSVPCHPAKPTLNKTTITFFIYQIFRLIQREFSKKGRI